MVLTFDSPNSFMLFYFHCMTILICSMLWLENKNYWIEERNTNTTIGLFVKYYSKIIFDALVMFVFKVYRKKCYFYVTNEIAVLISFWRKKFLFNRRETKHNIWWLFQPYWWKTNLICRVFRLECFFNYNLLFFNLFISKKIFLKS